MFIMEGLMVKIKYVEILDQGHLYPKLEVPILTHLGRESNAGFLMGGEHTSKELFEWRTY